MSAPTLAPALFAPVPFTPAPTKAGPLVFSDAHLLALLCYLAHGESTLGRNLFTARRVETDPTAHLYELRFGSWNLALAAAGLDITVQPLQLQGATTKWDNESMCAAIRLCLKDTSSTALAVYETWRTHPSQTNTQLPPAASIRARFGKWSVATAQACQTTTLQGETCNP